MTAPRKAGPGQPVPVVVGTAGHVDHGKSALVERLTGTHPDRLAEERRRGLTIDLGFAHCRLPGGVGASFVDVPGHEDFIRNMLAGVGGIRAALLVVAADEGPMPQTREHLAILDLLGVAHGVVALTKTDLVDEADWLAMVASEVRSLVEGTTLAAAPVVATSATTGAGVADLAQALGRALAAVPPAADLGRPRLSVDRSFTLSGFGTIATGTLRDGTIAPGEVLEVLPAGRPARVRAVQRHGHDVQRAQPGTRTALNLAGLEVAQVGRGDTVCAPGHYRPTRLMDVSVRVLADAAAPLDHDDEVILFLGAAAVAVRVRLMGDDAIAPGTSGFAQLVVARPAVAARGDRFILRRPSPGATVAGGVVLDPAPKRPHRRLRPGTRRRFEELAAGRPEDVVAHALAERPFCRGDDLEETRTLLAPPDRDAALEALARSGRIVGLGDLWVTAEEMKRLADRATRYVARYHRRHPLRVGPPAAELRSHLDLAPEAFGPWLEAAAAEGWLVVEPKGVRAPEHTPALVGDTRRRADDVLHRFGARPYSPPSLSEARDLAGADVVAALVDEGSLVTLTAEVALGRQAYDALLAAVVEDLTLGRRVTVASLRDRFGTSRKYALAFLEHLDRERVTRRVGDERVPGMELKAGAKRGADIKAPGESG